MITRTAVFPICPTKEQRESFEKTIQLYEKAFSKCIDVAWEMENLSSFKVHKATYASLKAELGLKSQYICSARNRAVESVRAMRVLKRKGKKVSKPQAKRIPIRLDARTLSFDKNREKVSVATQNGRVKLSLYWHKHAMRYREWPCKAGELGINRKGRWIIRLVFEKKVEKPIRTGKAIGVDRGIQHAIVASNNRFLGNGSWREHERKLLSQMSELQSKGTPSAKKHHKKTGRRLRRFKENCDRIVAKELFNDIQPGDTIVLEKLTNIRGRCGKRGQSHKKHRAKMGRWSFKRLENAITYLAEMKGVYVEYINPSYTSQMCSNCAVILKSNRKNQSYYSCACGLQLNADLNASRNIQKLWCMANGYTSGLPVNQPIVTNCH